MRGLKRYFYRVGYFKRWQSHLLQMRGLKPILTPEEFEIRVASFTDAWIET